MQFCLSQEHPSHYSYEMKAMLKNFTCNTILLDGTTDNVSSISLSVS